MLRGISFVIQFVKCRLTDAGKGDLEFVPQCLAAFGAPGASKDIVAKLRRRNKTPEDYAFN